MLQSPSALRTAPGLPSRIGFRPRYDPAARTLFAAFSSQPSDVRKSALNTFISRLKASGVWFKLDVIDLLAAHDSQAALLNVKSPGTFNPTLLLTPTFTTDRGFTTNGVDNAVQLNFNPATAGGQFTQNSAMFAVRPRTVAQVGPSSVGWFDGTDGVTMIFRSVTDTASFRINQAGASAHTAGSPTLTTGAYLLAANRSASNATQLYKDGVSMTVGTTPNQTSTTLNSNTLYLGRIATAGGYVALDFAACYLGRSLTAAEHASLAAADLAYMQAVGAA